MDKQTTINNWKKFSTHMHKSYLPNTIPKYGDSRLEDVTSQETRYWNIIRYATRLMAGRGKRHDLEKIVHYAQMAWDYNRRKAGKRGRLACVVCGNDGKNGETITITDSGRAMCDSCIKQSGEDDGAID